MNNRGFTFAEIITSVLLITIIAAGMFGAFVEAQHIFNRHRHKLQAFNFAREAQHRLRSDYGYTDSQMSVGDGHLESEIGSIISGEMEGFNTVLIYDVSEPEPGGYKTVTVYVTWDEPVF